MYQNIIFYNIVEIIRALLRSMIKGKPRTTERHGHKPVMNPAPIFWCGMNGKNPKGIAQSHRCKPVVRGKKVNLRPVRKSDLALLYLYKWINNPEVAKFWYGQDKPRSKEWVEKHFTPMVKGKPRTRALVRGKSESLCFIIEVKNKPIGFMYNTPQKEDDDPGFSGRVELDIMIGEPFKWGKGYGTDALKAMVDYAFKKQKAERVFIMPRVSNARAIHVYEKVGFKKEGVLRHYEKFEGKWVDCVMMAILRGEFKKQKKSRRIC